MPPWKSRTVQEQRGGGTVGRGRGRGDGPPEEDPALPSRGPPRSANRSATDSGGVSPEKVPSMAQRLLHKSRSGHNERPKNQTRRTDEVQKPKPNAGIARRRPAPKKESFAPLHKTPVKAVQVEGVVLMSIIKHCHTSLVSGKKVSGQILGMKTPDSDTLEVTYSFPLPQDESPDFQSDMMKCLSQNTKVDSMSVGVYWSALYSDYIKRKTLKNLANWQKFFPSAVLLIYDPAATNHGRLVIRAFQLTDEYMKMYNARHSRQDENCEGHSAFIKYNVEMESIFKEIPVKIHNSNLVHAFLYDLREVKGMSCDFDRLTHWRNDQLLHNMEMLEQLIEEYGEQHLIYRRYMGQVMRAKRARDAALSSGSKMLNIESALPMPPEPDRHDPVLLCAQMTEYSNQICESVKQAFSKTSVTQGLHPEE